MRNRIVIDTNIMCNAFLLGNDIPIQLKEVCTEIVFFFTEDNDYYLTLDNSVVADKVECLICDEYRDNLSNKRDFEVYYLKLFEKEKLVFVDSVVDADIAEQLKENHFHEKEDHTFVFTALASDKTIVSEDSDYGINSGKDDYHYCSFRYITDKLGLRLFDANRFWTMVSTP